MKHLMKLTVLFLFFMVVSCNLFYDDDDDEPTMYSVTVSNSIEHGRLSVDKTSAEAGATIKLTATADNGYELDSYSVKDASANGITVTDGTFTMPKSNVTVSATFKETAETVNQKAAAAVIAKITAIGTVAYTDESKAKIDEARTAYDALTEAQKALVPAETLALLTAAETTYAELKAAADSGTANQNAADAVIAKITAIGTVAYTDESKAKIDDARAAYDALTEAQKALVPAETLNLLTAAESTYAELKAAAEQQSADPETATYTVKHLQQNIADNNYTLKESETKTGTVGQPTAASAKSYDGFTAQTVTQVTVAASGTVVEIKYDRKSYTVTFNANGGSTVTSQSVRYGATATKPADPTKTATASTEYTFADWYSDSGLTTSFSFDTAIKEDITLYAKWTETAVTPQKTAGSISYATESVKKTTDSTAFTNELTKIGNGTVTYSSSDETVATVNASTGEVTIVGAGTATITATVTDSDTYTYATKTASYTVKVLSETLLTTITATGKEQASYSTANVATISFSHTEEGGSAYTANWGWWGYGWTATVTAAEGYTITKCVFYANDGTTATDSSTPFVVETTEEDKTPKVNGTIIKDNCKGIKKIEVYGYMN